MKLIVIGASGGCTDLVDLAQDISDTAETIEIVGFLDDRSDLQGRTIFGAKVLGGTSLISEIPDDVLFITGIGSSSNFHRKPDIISKFPVPMARWATLVHPSAIVSRFASVGAGCSVFPNVTIGPNVVLGTHVQVLSGCVISHDSRAGDYTIINGSCLIAGDVKIGRNCYVGARTAVRQNVEIGDSTLIGIGSVVLKDLPQGVIAYGVPAQITKHYSHHG